MLQDTGYPLEVYLPPAQAGDAEEDIAEENGENMDWSRLKERWVGWAVEYVRCLSPTSTFWDINKPHRLRLLEFLGNRRGSSSTLMQLPRILLPTKASLPNSKVWISSTMSCRRHCHLHRPPNCPVWSTGNGRYRDLEATTLVHWSRYVSTLLALHPTEHISYFRHWFQLDLRP